MSEQKFAIHATLTNGTTQLLTVLDLHETSIFEAYEYDQPIIYVDRKGNIVTLNHRHIIALTISEIKDDTNGSTSKPGDQATTEKSEERSGAGVQEAEIPEKEGC